MNLKSTTILSGIITLVRILSGVISVKVIAVSIGPAGVAYVGQFQSFIAIISNIAGLGIGNGVIKYVSEHKDDHINFLKTIHTSLYITLLSTFFIAIITFYLSDELSSYILGTNKYYFIFYILATTLILFSLGQLITQVFNGMQLIQALTKIKIYSSLLGVGITLVLVYFYGIVGALISLVISQVVIFFIALYFVKKENLLNASILKFSYDKQKARLLFGFSLMSIVSIVLTQARQMYLRDYVITNISTEAAGYWQAVWKISEMYLMIVTTSLSVYYLPKLSSTKSNNLLRIEIFKTAKFILPLVFFAAILIYLSRDLIINVLYTNEFNAIRDLFLFQLIGDFLKIAGWLISFLMVSKAMIKPFIITEIVFILTYLLFSVLLIPVYGLQGLTIAFAINYFLYLIFMIYYFRKILFQ